MNAGLAAAVAHPSPANQRKQNIALANRSLQTLDEVCARLYAEHIHEYLVF
jgi:hypothetical protein